MKKHSKKNDKKHSKKKPVKSPFPEGFKDKYNAIFLTEDKAMKFFNLLQAWKKAASDDINTFTSKMKAMLPSGAKLKKVMETPFGLKLKLNGWYFYYGLNRKGEFLEWRALLPKKGKA